MTKRERLKVYKKAYNLIYDGKNEFMCHAIENQSKGHSFYFSNGWRDNFPEFYAMSPNDTVLDFRDAWFEDHEKTPRLTVLAFCIAMCQ